MLTPKSPRPDTNSSFVSRRAVLKAAAWSIPAIAVATATPALAASGVVGDPGEDGGTGGIGAITLCAAPVLLGASWSSNNAQPTLEAGATGWTPASYPSSSRNPVQHGAYAGDLGGTEPIGWASLQDYEDLPGFLSVNNRAASGDETKLVVEQTYAVQEGFNYAFQILVAPRSAHLAVQLLDVDLLGSGVISRPVSGAGIATGTQILRIGVGNEPTHGKPANDVATPSWQAKYPNHHQLLGEGERRYDFSYRPVRESSVTIRYTLTLTADHGPWSPPLQNADLWVSMAQPVCA